MDEVTREVTLGAVREEVWEALTDPERLQEWLGEILAVELEPGGELVVRLPDGEERHGFVVDLTYVALRGDCDRCHDTRPSSPRRCMRRHAIRY